jgi:hypothetical protein
MPKQINPIRKAKVKQGLLKGKSARQAVLEADYSINTAINATKTNVVKHCTAEIQEERKATDITIQSLINEVENVMLLATNKKDLSVALNCIITKAKLSDNWVDKSETKDTTDKQEAQSGIDKLLSRNKL